MVVHYSHPQIKTTVTHSGTDYQLEGYSVVTDVFLVENAISQAIFTATDTKGETFLNKVDLNDNIKIEMQYADQKATSWTQIFGGWAFDLTPHLSTQQGEVVSIAARGYGLGLVAMPVGQEYGSQSRNSSLNTIKEALTDATKGIIPKWVEKVLNSATSSGYSYDTTKVADVSSDFRYLYWPYKPALNCIADMIDLISAANAPSAGAHWRVHPSGTTAYLCLATIGNHENPPADVWPTWWNTDQAGSTIEVGKDMVIADFTKQQMDANYILYHGVLRKPADGDKWTDYATPSSYWATVNASVGSASGASYKRVGSYSLKMTSDTGVTGYIRYPDSGSAGWDFTAIGGEYNIPSVNFYIRIGNNAESPIGVFFYSGVSDYYEYDLVQELSDQSGNLITNRFFHIGLPVGPYSRMRTPYAKGWTEGGSPDWSSLDAIRFGVKSKTGVDAVTYIDGLSIDGWVLRGARDDTKIGTQKARVKLIVDDVGKDDSTSATDDSYVMAQLAKAELYRSITTPIVGKIVIPGKEAILPGQLGHIHFGKKSDGSFNIDSDMRILEVQQHFGNDGFKSFLTLTDDVTNSRALQPNTGYNLMLKAAHPSFQTRETTSRKTRDIDITQTILSKNYST